VPRKNFPIVIHCFTISGSDSFLKLPVVGRLTNYSSIFFRAEDNMHGEYYLPILQPCTQEVDPMRKLLLSASLVGLMLAGASARTDAIPTPQSGQQSQQATKSIAGTVSSIGDNGRSFALEVKAGSDKQTLQFVLDQNTQVQGNVKVGTPVTVEYVAMADHNVAKSITAQG
jgi:hypothetical protein